MTTVHRVKGLDQARCSKCDHDLVTRKKTAENGLVYCSNSLCQYATQGHPTGSEPNSGPKAAA